MGVVNNLAANRVVSFGENIEISLLLSSIVLEIFNDYVCLEAIIVILINFQSAYYSVFFLLNLEKHKCSII